MQGSLGEFRLADILQLVAVQQKSGLLRLTRGTTLVSFYFDQGVLISTRDRRNASQDPLLDYLKRCGWLHPEAAASLKLRLEAGKEDLADLLVRDQHMSEDEVREALEDLAQELVHRTFTWRDGSYHFVGGDEVLAGQRHRVSIKIDSVLMEGARRADEWPRLLEKLPGPETVVERVAGAGVASDTRTRVILSLIDGPTRMADVLRASRASEYDTYETVLHAVEAGTVRVLERPAVAPALEPAGREARAARRARASKSRLRLVLPRPSGWVGGWTVALAVSAVSVLASAHLLPRLTSPTARRAAVELEMETARVAVRDGIEIYRALHGRYPASLATLVQVELASDELLRRAGPLHYEIAADGSGFALLDEAPASR